MTHQSAEPARTAPTGETPSRMFTIPELELNLTTLAAPDVPVTVRSMLRLRLPLWCVTGAAADDIGLAAVELASNACDATPSAEISFKARFDPVAATVWVGVWDSSPYRPTPRNPELSPETIDALPDGHEFGGWGLPIVLALSLESGASSTPAGKWVYAIFKGNPG